MGRGRWWGGGGDGVDIACAWRTIIITSIFAVQILSYLSLYCVLIICCQVNPSKEITRALDIAMLHPPSHKTVKDTPSTVCPCLITFSTLRSPLTIFHLHYLLAGHHAACVRHPVTGPAPVLNCCYW